MTTPTPPLRKPLDEEIDVWGLTHTGHVRPVNEDHFLIASLHKTLDIKLTSIPTDHEFIGADERLAFIAMVADGVGGRSAGEEASRLTLESVTRYVTRSMQCYYQSDAHSEEFVDLLQDAVMRGHEEILAHAARDFGHKGMATTLTLWLGVWPWNFLVQVGDSRYYQYRGGSLTQVSRDQTMAQELVDQGVMTRSVAFASRWANVLSSAIGGQQTAPVVTRMASDWEAVHLLCSDGLTKHVSDEQITERLRTMTSARQVCEQLLQDALDGGGTDNVSIIVGRVVPTHDHG
jgi:serine/threonine protein phosphatase PrpC